MLPSHAVGMATHASLHFKAARISASGSAGQVTACHCGADIQQPGLLISPPKLVNQIGCAAMQLLLLWLVSLHLYP